MTTVEMSQYIGKEARYAPNGELCFNVRITDAKVRYGTLRFLVEPMNGSGSAWVQSTSVVLWATEIH